MLDAVGNGDGVVGIVLRKDNTAAAILGDGEVVSFVGGHVCFAVHIYHISEVADARCVNQVDTIVNGDSSYNCMAI